MISILNNEELGLSLDSQEIFSRPSHPKNQELTVYDG